VHFDQRPAPSEVTRPGQKGKQRENIPDCAVNDWTGPLRDGGQLQDNATLRLCGCPANSDAGSGKLAHPCSRSSVKRGIGLAYRNGLGWSNGQPGRESSGTQRGGKDCIDPRWSYPVPSSLSKLGGLSAARSDSGRMPQQHWASIMEPRLLLGSREAGDREGRALKFAVLANEGRCVSHSDAQTRTDRDPLCPTQSLENFLVFVRQGLPERDPLSTIEDEG
jgi:hypothetical protein